VPQGEHLVQMEFAPESYRIASTVSVCAELIFFITLLGAVILIVTKRPVRRG
jgi:hypothetical protein